MVRYYDPQMLALANPANSKNELQAAGDAFKQMYKDYEMYKLSQDRLKMSNLEREYAEKTQDDRIKQSNLTTQGLQNKVDLSALELDTARKSQKDLLEGIRLDTLGKEQDLNKKIIENHFLPQEKKANINQANASASNLYANARLTNLKSNITQHEFNENKEAKSALTDFNEFANNNPNLKGDDLKNAYAYNIRRKIYNELNNPLLDNHQKIINAQTLQDKLDSFNKHLPNIAQLYNISEQSFNPIPKGGGNGVNGGRNNSISNVDLAMFNKAQEQNKAIEQEILNNKKKIQELGNKIVIEANNRNDTSSIRQEIMELQKKQNELISIKNQNNAYIENNTTGIYTMLKDTLARQGFSKPEEEIQEIQDLLLLSKGLNDIYDVLENGKGRDFNVGYTGNIGRAFTRVGGNSHPIDLLENRTKTFMKIYQNSGTKLKSQYEDIRSVFPDYTGWWQSKNKVVSDLRDIEESIRNQINNKLSAYNNESKELVKSLVDNIYTSKYSLKATQ